MHTASQHRAIASSKIWRTHWMTVRFICWLLYFPSQLLHCSPLWRCVLPFHEVCVPSCA